MKKLFAFCLFLVVAQAHALDIYIGTIEVDKGQAILKRCDLVENRYALLDEKKSTQMPVKYILQQAADAKGPIYGEVIGDYKEQKGVSVLIVKSINNIQKNKSCHLEDLESNTQ